MSVKVFQSLIYEAPLSLLK